MTIVGAELPEDVNALKAIILALAEKSAVIDNEIAELEVRNAYADEHIERLTSIIKMLDWDAMESTPGRR